MSIFDFWKSSNNKVEEKKEREERKKKLAEKKEKRLNLLKELMGVEFPAEVPKIGTKVRVAYIDNYGQQLYEATVINRRCLTNYLFEVTVSVFHFEEARIGTQNFVSFFYNSKKNEWNKGNCLLLPINS